MDNIRALAVQVFPRHPNETEWMLRLAKRAGIGKESVRRMVKGIGSPRLDNVEAVAHALGVSLTDLLSSQFNGRKPMSVVPKTPGTGVLQSR
jgi:transcriptional regulator with XRE-family HTH domain